MSLRPSAPGTYLSLSLSLSPSSHPCIPLTTPRLHRSTGIIGRVFYNNSLDLILSLTLGLTSSFLSYASPFFLKQILEALTPPAPGQPYDPTLRQNAYIYALLAFLAQVSRAEVDLQQLWHERRAITRTRTQLMGEVYEKALKRRDASGATGKGEAPKGPSAPTKGKGNNGKGAPNKGKKAIPEARGTTSTGKIVSLMAGDVNKVANQLMSLSSIFGAPFELVIAITFLYQVRTRLSPSFAEPARTDDPTRACRSLAGPASSASASWPLHSRSTTSLSRGACASTARCSPRATHAWRSSTK